MIIGGQRMPCPRHGGEKNILSGRNPIAARRTRTGRPTPPRDNGIFGSCKKAKIVHAFRSSSPIGSVIFYKFPMGKTAQRGARTVILSTSEYLWFVEFHRSVTDYEVARFLTSMLQSLRVGAARQHGREARQLRRWPAPEERQQGKKEDRCQLRSGHASCG